MSALAHQINSVHLYLSRDTSFPSMSLAEKSYMDLADCQSLAWAHCNKQREVKGHEA